MRIFAAIIIVLGILFGLGFQSTRGAGDTAASGRDATLSILDLHRNHPGMKRMPTQEIPLL